MSKPKHQQVFEALNREILTGRYAAGKKFPSEAALAKRFHASRITVGRAVRDLQQRGLVERFAGSGTYVRAAGANSRQGPLFGLIIPDLGGTEIFEPICQGIANTPDSGGHALLWPHANGGGATREEQVWQLCEQCILRRVSGVFFAPLEMSAAAGEVNRRVVNTLKRAEIPIVFLDRRPEYMASRDRCDLVSIDNERAGYLATNHLLKLDARRIGFLAYRGQASSILGRIAGYRQALSSPGVLLEVSSDGPFELPPQTAKCDAFVCSNDHVAGRLMLALIAKGRRIPRDVRIVGIDDVTYAALLPVPLTTVHQPCGEIGKAALQVMLERLAHPRMPAREVLLDCELVVRESCGAYKIAPGGVAKSIVRA
jgi:DNA-binding LacI/PurR family transcriptional regulator